MIDAKLRKSYVPMTETAFYILISLVVPKHGYAIINEVEEMTNQRITLGPGTLYGSLSKMRKDGLIEQVKEEGNRKTYVITELGLEILHVEKHRIEELYKNSRGDY